MPTSDRVVRSGKYVTFVRRSAGEKVGRCRCPIKAIIRGPYVSEWLIENEEYAAALREMGMRVLPIVEDDVQSMLYFRGVPVLSAMCHRALVWRDAEAHVVDDRVVVRNINLAAPNWVLRQAQFCNRRMTEAYRNCRNGNPDYPRPCERYKGPRPAPIWVPPVYFESENRHLNLNPVTHLHADYDQELQPVIERVIERFYEQDMPRSLAYPYCGQRHYLIFKFEVLKWLRVERNESGRVVERIYSAPAVLTYETFAAFGAPDVEEEPEINCA